jgi:hypothetical protein
MDGWGGMYWEAGKGRPGYLPSSAEDGVCTSAGRSGSDYSGEMAKKRVRQSFCGGPENKALGPKWNLTILGAFTKGFIIRIIK